MNDDKSSPSPTILLFGPGIVDDTLRQFFRKCWSSLPLGQRNVVALEQSARASFDAIVDEIQRDPDALMFGLVRSMSNRPPLTEEVYKDGNLRDIDTADFAKVSYPFGSNDANVALRYAFNVCWFCIPAPRVGVEAVIREMRRLLVRVIEDIREDASAFGLEVPGGPAL